MSAPGCRELSDAQPSKSLTWSSLSSCPLLALYGSHGFHRNPLVPLQMFFRGRQEESAAWADTHTSNSGVTAGSKAINDMGMAHQTSEAGFTCLKKFGKIIFEGFL